MNRHLFTALLLILLLALPVVHSLSSEETVSAPVDSDLFEGKIVSVYVDDPLKGAGQILREAELKKVADRWILIGTAVHRGPDGDLDEGSVYGVAWESVVAFHLITPEQFEEKLQSHAE
jgi:hypothetical protein